jgi:hypothetical protein
MTAGSTLIEWYSGHTLYDRPRRLFWGDQWLEVMAVLERAYFPDGARCTILASDHGVYLLEYSSSNDAWHITASA